MQTCRYLAMLPMRMVFIMHFKDNRLLKSVLFKPCISSSHRNVIPLGCQCLYMTSGDVCPINVVVYICLKKFFQCLVEQLQDRETSDSRFTAWMQEVIPSQVTLFYSPMSSSQCGSFKIMHRCPINPPLFKHFG